MLVQKIANKAELGTYLQEYFATDKTVVLLEEYVEGMELTCGVIGNDEVMVLPPSYTVATEGVLSMEEKFLPGAGENHRNQHECGRVDGEIKREEFCRHYRKRAQVGSIGEVVPERDVITFKELAVFRRHLGAARDLVSGKKGQAQVGEKPGPTQIGDELAD